MKVIYQAENAIDANLLKGLLEQDGIMAFVNGQYLQGGIGELPASGLITVSVGDDEEEAALKIVAEFQSALADNSSNSEIHWGPGKESFDWKT
jgi:hypothetical protein